MPFERWRYPTEWPSISRAIRLRSGGQCEGPPERPLEADGRCSARHDAPHPITGSRVILTVAHLNHRPLDCRPDNLRALCQRCHLNYDRGRHIAAAKAKRRRARAVGELFPVP